MAPLLVGLPSPQLMVAVKSAVWSPGLASLKVATVTVPVEAPSVALMGAPAVAVRAASATVADRLALVLAPPMSAMSTVGRALRRARGEGLPVAGWLPATAGSGVAGLLAGSQ